MKAATTILAGVLAAQQVMATWGDSGSYSSPANSDNKCDDKQKGGWDFDDLDTGDFNSYGDHDFSGFTCKKGSDKFKRGLEKRTGFGGNCISGNAHSSGGPSFKCGKDKDAFSINQIHFDTDEDSDYEFHYSMGDGSTCKQKQSCKSGGQIVQNEQCGGATAVSIQLPKTATHSCSASIYSVGFDCSTASSTTPYSSKFTGYIPSSSKPYYPITSSTSEKPEETTPSYSVPEYSSPSYSKPGYSSPSYSPSYPGYSSPSVPLSTGYSYATPSYSTPSSYSSPSESIPSYSAPSSYSSPSESVPSSYPSVPLSTGPTYSTPESPETPSSYPSVPLSTGPSSYPETPSTPTSYAPVPSSSCPTVLPKCLNSWIWQTGCKDNGDYACYCKQPDFSSKVCGCLSAYGADDDETAKAASYLLGICADYVGDNYGLAMNCPKPSSPSSPESPKTTPESTPNSPVTPTSYPETQTTVYVTNSIFTCPVGYTVTSKGTTTTLETPSVSTISLTVTSTICTKCTAAPTPTPESPVTAPGYSPAAPVTTISISKTYTVPVTYTTGVSAGLTAPSSSTPTVVATSYTVPQVVITPGAGPSSSGGLVYGSAPASAPAETSAGGVYGAPSPSAGFGTTYVPKGTTAAPVATFTGAANKMAAGSFGGLVIAGIALAL